MFAKGKEEEPDSWAFKTAATNGKTDISNIWSTAVVSDGNAYLNLAFHRVGGGDTSNAFFSFELNQSDVGWQNSQGTVVPCRTNGDVLISYELPDTIKLYKWTNGTGGPASCPDGGRGDWSGPTNPAAQREAAVNSAVQPIPSTLPDGPATMDRYTFGETSMNLAEVVREVGLDSCKYYKGVQAHSRESAAFSSTMSDFVGDTPIGIVACPAPPDPNADPAPDPTDLSVASSCSADGTITLSGKSAAGTEVEILEGLTSVGPAVAPDANGDWSLTFNTSDGSHTYSAIAHQTGHPASDPVDITVVVDATRPAAPVITSPASGATVAPGTVTVSGTAEPLSEIEITETGAVVGQATTGADGTWSTTLTVVGGSHTFEVTAADCASGAATVLTLNASSGAGSGGDTGGSGGGPAGPTGPTTPQQEILGDDAAGACATKVFSVFIPGKGVKRVVFRVDGVKIKTVRKKDSQKRFVFRVDPKTFQAGKHKISARLFLRNGKKRTVPMRSFTRCKLGKCVSRRSFRIHVKKIRGEKVVSATVRVNGKKVKVVRGKRLTAPVVLTGLPKGKVIVKIVSRTKSGRKVTDTRRYRTCVPKKKS